MTPDQANTLLMDGWPGGINNRLRETESRPGTRTDHRDQFSSTDFLREAINVDLTALGHPLRRSGYSLQHSGFTHSLWSDETLSFGLCIHNGHLTQISESGDLTPLQEVTPYLAMSYACVNGVVYWSNGVDKGRVDHYGVTHWGLPNGTQPLLSYNTDSLLTNGTYRVVTTYVDSDGVEYGASKEAHAQVTTGLTITISESLPGGAEYQNIYISQPDGEVLYKYTSVSSPKSIVVAQVNLGKGKELETQGLQVFRPGRVVRYFSGRIWVARQQTLYFSEALNYSLCRPAQGVFMFASSIIMVEPVIDGVYVGTQDGVFFLRGTNPYDMVQVPVSSYAPVPRAVTRVPGDKFDAPISDVPIWWDSFGCMVAGKPGGTVEHLTKDRIAPQKFSVGAMLYRHEEGMSHIVSSLRGNEDSTFAATDSVVAEVRSSNKVLNQ